MTEQPDTPKPPLRVTKCPERSANCGPYNVFGTYMPVKAIAALMIADGVAPSREVVVARWWDAETYSTTLEKLAAPRKARDPDKPPPPAPKYLKAIMEQFAAHTAATETDA